MLTQDQKLIKCREYCKTFIDVIRQIDPTTKILILMESEEISISESTASQRDYSEALGLLEVFGVRLRICEEENFKFRRQAQQVIERFEGENVISIDKEKLN